MNKIWCEKRKRMVDILECDPLPCDYWVGNGGICFGRKFKVK